MKILRERDSIDEIRSYLPVFASREYLSAKSDEYGWLVEDKFILPFIIQKIYFFKRMIFTTDTILLEKDIPIEMEQRFLNEVVGTAREMKIDFIDQPQTNVVFRTVPTESIFCPFGSYFVDLSLDEETLFKNLHIKHRNVIRKAIKDGVIIDKGPQYINVCYEIIRETLLRQKKPSVTLEQLKKFSCALKENISFYVAVKDEIVQGCAVLFWNKLGCYYLYGGSREKPYIGSMNYLHWQAMLDMKQKGVSLYDFVGARINPLSGSKVETLQRFKERFGGNLRKGYLWKYPVNPGKYSLYKILKNLYNFIRWQKMSSDIIDEEKNG